jgi:alkanesulfonate monooxygenase SsuD/methylene tetrahydromethanopterin reductase-like flavin-dependent oxidoreductase (luciferase family)
VRLGISVASSYPNTPAPEAVANVVARAAMAAEVGLDHLSLGDQHATGPDRGFVQSVPVLGRIMADWPVDRAVGLLLLLPLWHPVLAAEQIATLAAMSAVPFVVQTGIGSGDGQFAAMGRRRRDRGRHTDEAIRTIKALFAGERVSSEALHVHEASIAPRPPHGVEWWVGAGPGDAPLERAAREGDAWYAGPGTGPADIARYRAKCSAHGRSPRVVQRRDVLVGDDDAATVRRGRDLLAAGYRGMTEDLVDFGGVARVGDRLAALAAAGVDDVVVRTMAVDQASALRSIELIGEVRRALRT